MIARFTVVVCAMLALHAADSSACSAILVGKKASATGRVVVSHNLDGPLSIVMRHAFVPAHDGKLGFFWSECKDPQGGVFPGDVMLNECGVIVMSNNGGFMKTWVGKPGVLPDEGEHSALKNGGLGFEFRRTVAERAHSAREGVAIATNLLATSGYNQPSRNFAIADKDEIWVIQVVLGKRYVARRCPDDEVVAYPNCMTVGSIKPDDMVSANIEAKRDTFDFAATYQGPRTWKSPYNFYRLKYLYKISCGVDVDPNGVCPFSVRPAWPVTSDHLKAALSTHYEGTPDAIDPCHPTKATEVAEKTRTPICRASTLESIVCTFADSVTNIELSVATGRPCETPYVAYRPFGGVLPTDVSRGDMAIKRLRDRAVALPRPVRTGVFAGAGPRSNGFTEYLRLVAASPDLELTLLDAEDIRSGALDKLDLLIVPGGDSRMEKRDLGPKGAEKIHEFLRAGGGYIGSCAGCCLLMDSVMDPKRGIGIIPYRRTGSKGGYMMPVAVNEKGAKALGIEKKTYVIRYHGGPVLEPSTNAIADAKFEIWGTYAHDFGKPGAKPEMVGRGAMVGGTFGKGKVFAFTVHPENFTGTRELLRGAFRYVTGRDVTFPERKRKAGAYVVGWCTNAVRGKEPARTMLAVDALEGADLFPIASDEIMQNMLDHLDVLVLPDGDRKVYGKRFTPELRTLIAAFRSRGGRIIAWGAGAKASGGLAQDLGTAEAVLADIKRVSENTKSK